MVAEVEPDMDRAGRVSMTRHDLGHILKGIDASVRLDEAHRLASDVNWRGALSRPIHRWFKYREGFSPNLIRSLGLGESILDPFAGSGSILVGAAESGRGAVGIDINPLAVFVARVKVTPLTPEELAIAGSFLRRVESDVETMPLWPMPRLSIATKVFEPGILATLLRIRGGIESLGASARVRDFILLAWLSVLQPVGSYFKEGNGIKYRNRRRTASGYVPREDGEWQRDRFGEDQEAFVRDTFRRQLLMMIHDSRSWNWGSWGRQLAIAGSALDAVSLVGEREFDSVVFSPPYANRFDYFESLKVELWFGGFVDSYEDLGALRKRSLRSHLGADLSLASRPTDGLEGLISLMDPTASSWRMGVPDALRGYFHDMWETLVAVRAVLKRGGECHVVVGNSAYAGVVIPTDALLARLALDAGFNEARVRRVRHLTVAPQQRSLLGGLESYMRESVVTLR